MNRHSRTPICASVALALILSLMLPAALAAEEPSFPLRGRARDLHRHGAPDQRDRGLGDQRDDALH